MKHVFDPAAFSEDYGAPWPVMLIAIATSMAGLVIFSSLIGLITAGIQRRIEGLERGNTAVAESGHTLLLGWSQKAPTILRTLPAAAAQRCTRDPRAARPPGRP